ncbi:hypothetical protein JMJ77_0004732 [Colletotrichum scovillei]|uniref:Uncharacterized protein n=1 Tax=Colletotrichum scovillei TaxID=1209932 RepID=A0A9P7RHL4_9PEZI|nr:hypothetical protein JMJ77_0004732 [Colletotrichum scovillei]KAG7075976.1 hypothetical protein JMJ76_0013248 [Colletotrichum scovillei]KAG7083121.1 hypothetical protein JMJ78_0008571 [Colletotrichum scovillei]
MGGIREALAMYLYAFGPSIPYLMLYVYRGRRSDCFPTPLLKEPAGSVKETAKGKGA